MKTIALILCLMSALAIADEPVVMQATKVSQSELDYHARKKAKEEAAVNSAQSSFTESFWLLCDFLDESGYTAAHPLPAYDWQTVNKLSLPIAYWLYGNASADMQAKVGHIFAIVVSKAQLPGVDTSVVKPTP